MILLNRSGNNARDADAVAAHFHDLLFLILVEELRAQLGGIRLPQREYMTHFDATPQLEHTFAIGRCIAVDDTANVGHNIRFRAIAPPVAAGDVITRFVGSADEIRHRCGRAIRYHDDFVGMRVAMAWNRAAITGLNAEVSFDFFGSRWPVIRERWHFAQLDFVDHVIGAQHAQHEARIAHVHHRFELLLNR